MQAFFPFVVLLRKAVLRCSFFASGPLKSPDLHAAILVLPGPPLQLGDLSLGCFPMRLSLMLARAYVPSPRETILAAFRVGASLPILVHFPLRKQEAASSFAVGTAEQRPGMARQKAAWEQRRPGPKKWFRTTSNVHKHTPRCPGQTSAHTSGQKLAHGLHCRYLYTQSCTTLYTSHTAEEHSP